MEITINKDQPITRQYREHLRQLESSLRDLALKLLAPQTAHNPERPDLRANHLPLNRSPFVREWQELFKREGVKEERHRGIRNKYETITSKLVESRGSSVGLRAYEAVEAWLREKTLVACTGCPRTTLGLIWYVAAVHNWLWCHDYWRRESAEESSSEKELLGELHKLIGEHLDPLLGLLDHSVLESGDLIAVHLMQETLTAAQSPEEELPEPLRSRLDSLTWMSPVTRFEHLVSTEDRLAPDPWRWLERFISDEGCAALRQYFASKMGERIQDPIRQPPKKSPDRLPEILQALQGIDEQLIKSPGPLPGNVDDAWHRFVGEILWASLAELTPEASERLWKRWSHGYPEHLTLAQWAGRLARRAECSAQSKKPHEYTEAAWRWFDLARAALHSWISGRDHATLCLGLWLEGFLGSSGQGPPLILTARATGRALDQLIEHWLRAVEVQKKRSWYKDFTESEKNAVTVKLEALLEKLGAQPLFQKLRPEDLAGEEASKQGSPAQGEEETLEETSIDPPARIIEFQGP